MSVEQLNAEQQEIIELLRNEITDLVETNTSVFEEYDLEAQKELLSHYEVHVEHIANAVELAGLLGLSDACKLLVENFKAIRENFCPVNEAVAHALQSWGKFVLQYLNGIDNDGQEAIVKDFLNFLSLDVWPMALSVSKRKHLYWRFFDSTLSTFDEEKKNQVPSQATAEMTSLDYGEDVRAELIDGMLIELPQQVRSFETSVEQFLSSKNLEDLSQARRMAHTLKGAANIVGVRGLANLMHYTEDLFESGAKKWNDIPEGFNDLVVDVSDNLAMIAEYLVGIAGEPDNLQEVMQATLDWLHNITTEDESPEEESSLNDIPAQQSQESSVELDKSTTETAIPQPDETSTNSATPEKPVTVVSASLQTEDSKASPQADQKAPITEDKQSTTKTAQIKTETKVEAKNNAAPETGEEREETHTLNVPENTAHELLRIAGEIQISNTQVMAQLEAMNASIHLTDRYHQKIKAMSSELEALIQTQSAMRTASMEYSEDEMDPLEMERYSELHTFSQQLLELTTDSYEAVSHIEHQINELSNIAYSQKQLNQDNQSLLLELRMIPVNLLTSRFSRCVRQASRLTGKSAKLEIEGGDLLLDSRVLNNITDPIMHLLRNAVDHGLEDSGRRRQLEKDEQGTVTLSFINSGETVTIECKDDGRGLNYDSIRTKAIEQGLLEENSSPSTTVLNQLILMPGFSTRSTVSQTSGRGIGLDAVMAEIKALKGSLHVSSTEGEGSTFTITVPASILTSHALLVRCDGSEGQQIISVVTRSIEQIIYTKQKQIIKEDEQYFYKLEDEKIPVYDINDITHIHRFHGQRTSALLIVRKSDGNKIGVAVESIIASQNLVIKPLNPFTYRPEGVIGATILGDGTVSPVIDLLELPGMNLSFEELNRIREQRSIIAEMERNALLDPPVALIVDDSLSARRSLAQFVTDIGMKVYTAKDGFEAISILSEKKPALMLVDLEMPRMNGLELTSHVRSREDTRDIPVIMITSRTTEKHRSLAKTAGVNTYLNKPWSDNELLSCIEQQLPKAS